MTTDSGVSDAGLMTTVLPQISAAMPFHAGMAIGKFHGVIRPATPRGMRTAMLNLLCELGRRGHAEQTAPFARGEEGHVDRFLDVALRLVDDLAHLARHLARHLVLAALEDVADAVEDTPRASAPA